MSAEDSLHHEDVFEDRDGADPGAAVERGEISPASLSPRIASLAVDLVRHDLIMNQAPVPDVTPVEIVDKIFLPLVRPDTRG